MSGEEKIADDRDTVKDSDLAVLIVEDDPHYARVLLGLARDKGFKGIVATRGKQALDLALEYVPAAITLDIFLPDMLGWTVLNNLKLNPKTRHIPVQIISLEEERQHGLAHGAFSYMVKPVTTEGLESCSIASRISSLRTSSGCWWWRTMSWKAAASPSCSCMTTSRFSMSAQEPPPWTHPVV